MLPITAIAQDLGVLHALMVQQNATIILTCAQCRSVGHIVLRPRHSKLLKHIQYMQKNLLRQGRTQPGSQSDPRVTKRRPCSLSRGPNCCQFEDGPYKTPWYLLAYRHPTTVWTHSKASPTTTASVVDFGLDSSHCLLHFHSMCLISVLQYTPIPGLNFMYCAERTACNSQKCKKNKNKLCGSTFTILVVGSCADFILFSALMPCRSARITLRNADHPH